LSSVMLIYAWRVSAKQHVASMFYRMPLSLSDDLVRVAAWRTTNTPQNSVTDYEYVAKLPDDEHREKYMTGDEYGQILFFNNTNHHIFLLKHFCTLDGVVVNIWSGAVWQKQIDTARC
jgi:hypothetical protein